MSEVVKVKNFKPEKIAPNFVAHLKKAGDVAFGEEVGQTSRFGFRNDNRPYVLASREVLLNGEPIGQLEVGLQPPAVVYTGQLPESLVPTQPRRWDKIHFPNGRRPGGFATVTLVYKYDDPLSTESGRSDNWIGIPLP